MALDINTIRSEADGGRWVNRSGQRLALDKDGKVVADTDPAAVSLLVGAGGVLPRAVAEQHGLIGEKKGRRGSNKALKGAEDKGEEPEAAADDAEADEAEEGESE